MENAVMIRISFVKCGRAKQPRHQLALTQRVALVNHDYGYLALRPSLFHQRLVRLKNLGQAKSFLGEQRRHSLAQVHRNFFSTRTLDFAAQRRGKCLQEHARGAVEPRSGRDPVCRLHSQALLRHPRWSLHVNLASIQVRDACSGFAELCSHVL